MLLNRKLLFSTLVFAGCIVPTLVSYAPYSFRWDDSDYLWRSIAVSRAFWSGNRHELVKAMLSIRPPVMTLLGLPWGPLASWDAAGKGFITLTAVTGFFVACCLFFLLRIGLRPLYLAIASVCVFAALGPYPTGADAHLSATGFMADSLFAWNAFAGILLIPYEARAQASSTRDGLLRGLLWGIIFSVGAITKVSFLYFVALIIPVLFVVRMRHAGLRSAILSLTSLAVCSLPAAIYWLRYGLPVLKYGRAASFGPTAPLYFVPFTRFLSLSVRQSPGLLLPVIFAIAGTVYVMIKRRDAAWETNAFAILIMVGYCTISLASSNREIRFLFPGIIALPFLVGILISRTTDPVPRGFASLAAMLAFCCLVVAGVPMLHRASRQSIDRSEAVLAQAVEFRAKRVLLATDSSTLNDVLMKVAVAVSPSRLSVETDSLAWRAALGWPIEDDFRAIRESDLIVFQNNEDLDSPFTNQRVSQYEQYTREHFGSVPIKAADDIRIYCTGCRTLAEAPVREQNLQSLYK